MDKKLKLCPFCGEEAEFVPEHVKRKDPAPVLMVRCRGCGATPWMILLENPRYFETYKNLLTNKWNHRTNAQGDFDYDPTAE
jgi:hypothetical protein